MNIRPQNLNSTLFSNNLELETKRYIVLQVKKLLWNCVAWVHDAICCQAHKDEHNGEQRFNIGHRLCQVARRPLELLSMVNKLEPYWLDYYTTIAKPFLFTWNINAMIPTWQHHISLFGANWLFTSNFLHCWLRSSILITPMTSKAHSHPQLVNTKALMLQKNKYYISCCWTQHIHDEN